ncbi:MAG: class I SAM-dependent methyltransferase [Pseudonocardiaceae bacterium]
MRIANVEAAKSWNGFDGEHWTEHEERYNASLRPHAARLSAAAAITATDDVLDVGCGCGESTREAARSARSVLGVDLSSRMIGRARERAEAEGLGNVAFEVADAQVHPFAARSVDLVLSRAGVMFFADPVAAFTNLHAATRPGGRLVVLTWQGLDRNPWVSLVRDALTQGRELPAPQPGEPGPFGLAEPDVVRPLLERAGWSDVRFSDVAAPLRWASDLDDAMTFLAGRARGMIEDLDPSQQAAALDALRAALEPHAGPDGVVLGSRAWVITAAR